MDYVIIVAGGKGLRMGTETPKQFLPVAGKPCWIADFTSPSMATDACATRCITILIFLNYIFCKYTLFLPNCHHLG